MYYVIYTTKIKDNFGGITTVKRTTEKMNYWQAKQKEILLMSSGINVLDVIKVKQDDYQQFKI